MTTGNDRNGSGSEFYDARAAFEQIKRSIDPSKTAKSLIDRAKAEVNRLFLSDNELKAVRLICGDKSEVKTTID